MGLAWLPWMAVFGVARVVVSGLMGLLIVYAVLSWVQARSPINDVIARLCEPLLQPVRRVLPLVGGIDLSPLVLLVLLQVAMIVLGHLQAGVVG
jgi:YggT family protein